MHNSSIPSTQEIPSTSNLIKSTIVAIIIAGILLVTVVMPAEYGIDPTGIGEATGLKKMGEVKVSLAKEAAADRTKDMAADTQAEPVKPEVVVPVPEPMQSTSNHEMQVTLAPDEGTEIKVTMTKGNKVRYS